MAEALLWNELRRKQMLGFKFRRQQALGRFIVDFYCHEANLVIEIDGSVHVLQQDEDEARQTYLEQIGIRVLRFSNEAINDSMEEVLNTTASALRGGQSLTP